MLIAAECCHNCRQKNNSSLSSKIILDNFSSIFYNFGFNLTRCSIAEHTMAKIKPMDLVKSMSGKVCEHSDISFAKRGDTQYTVKRCNERDLEKNPYTEAELAHQAKFKSVAASTTVRVKTNDPEDVAAFKAQKKYKSFRSYIWAQEWASYTAD